MINNLDIKCIGYQKAFNGFKMYHYKLKVVNKEYLVVDTSIMSNGVESIITIIWTDENEFKNGDLTNQFKDLIMETLPLVPKVEDILTEETKKLFFTQNIIPEIVKPKKQRKTKGIYTSDELNYMMDVFGEFDFLYDAGSNENIITKEIVNYAKEEYDYNLLNELLGYRFYYEVDGTHKNDGQMVTYYFTLTSPLGAETHFETEMCLMVGFNFCNGGIIINKEVKEKKVKEKKIIKETIDGDKLAMKIMEFLKLSFINTNIRVADVSDLVVDKTKPLLYNPIDLSPTICVLENDSLRFEIKITDIQELIKQNENNLKII